MATSEFTIPQKWQPDRRSPVRWILSHALRHKLLALGMLAGAFGTAAMGAVTPVSIGRAFDAVRATPPDLHGLAVAAALIAASQLIRGAVIQLGRNFSAETIGQSLERDIRNELYVSLIGKSMSFHDRQPSGDLMARATNDVREINLMFSPGLNLVIGSLNFLLMPVFVAPTIHPQLILAPLLYLVCYGLLVWNFLRQLRPAAEQVRRSFGLMNARLAEAIEGIETVKGSAQEESEAGRFIHVITGWRRAYVTQGDIEAFYPPLLLLGLLHGVGFLHSLLLFRAGVIGVGDVISFNGLLLLFIFPTFSAQFSYARVASGVASARRILELINAETELDQNVGGYDGHMQGEVCFEDVTFRYQGPHQPGSPHQTPRTPRFSGEPPAEAGPPATRGEGLTLGNISFRVEPGQTVAIVGQTGSGKSTIAKLLNRTYDVDGGRVLIDGVDVRDWNLETLRRQISIIEQDIFLFSRTIAENIAFGRPGASRAEIEAAAQVAQAHEFIVTFKDGYDTLVGERGVTLSGGQRQRLALARAFLTQPAILILDDATSAIDSETEDRIQRAIERVAAGRTTFLITHRLSQIRWADLIVVMRKGRVAAVGTHEQLMQESAAYRNIFARYES
jgi:ATP-binding cassette subfamily B protein